jgi:hypothetical protein
MGGAADQKPGASAPASTDKQPAGAEDKAPAAPANAPAKSGEKSK